MRTTIYYIFLPTVALLEAVREFGADTSWLIEPAVWCDSEHDRIGKENSQQTVEHSFWTVFLAQLVSEHPESESEQRFREKCQSLGFEGCWSAVITKSGGIVSELVEEAKEAASFLANYPKERH